MVIAEVALTLMLLTTALLLIRSFWQLLQVSPGFRPESITALDVSLGRRYSEATEVSFFRNAALRLRDNSNIRLVTAVNLIPVSGKEDLVPISRDSEAISPPMADERTIFPDYFKTLRIPVLHGRTFTDHDQAEAPAVAIVSDTLSRQLFHGENPLGEQITFAEGGKILYGPLTIVGVVGDVHNESLESAPRPQVYLPFDQNPQSVMTLLVSSNLPPAQVAADVRAVFAGLDPTVPVTHV